EGHRGAVWALAFSPGGKLLASSGQDQQIRVHDLSSGRTVRAIPTDAGAWAWGSSMAYSPDGRLLALSCRVPDPAGGEAAAVRVWDAGTGKLLRERPCGPGRELPPLAFS